MTFVRVGPEAEAARAWRKSRQERERVGPSSRAAALNDAVRPGVALLGRLGQTSGAVIGCVAFRRAENRGCHLTDDDGSHPVRGWHVLDHRQRR